MTDTGHMGHAGPSSLTLPPELWLKICFLLDLPDAGNFRLVCKTFGGIGARIVLRRLIVHADPDNHSLLRILSRDRAKSKYLQSLIYTPAPVRKSWTGDWPAGHVLSNDGQTRQQAYAKLDQQRDAHSRVQGNPLICDLLPAVLPKLTGLRSVIINCEGWHQCSNRYGARGSYTPLTLIHRQHGKPGSRLLVALLGALEKSDTKLETLKAGRLEWRSIGDLPQTPAQLAPFSNLTDLNLHFCVCGIDRFGLGAKHPDLAEYARVNEAKMLPNFLAALPRLRALAIAFCSLSPRGPGVSEGWLRDVVRRGQHWPHLASLSFGGMNLTKSLLMDVLARHKDTLRRLELFSVWLDGHWPSALAEMRDMLTLEDATIWSGLCGDQGRWKILDHPEPLGLQWDLSEIDANNGIYIA
ncbi:hypothetical protein F5144DRAFT_629275 [Chaetomium tenue]|uniref:Uncharacterized protein n=1 Tax=Chaetomium tenue TaxID=1854479 RepID=A0ACB7P8R1_9PEZI|nr:hypothetical protein F5144DRAFT_629275 [Chaetomium globosum]